MEIGWIEHVARVRSVEDEYITQPIPVAALSKA
jgi:hypothetical protein